jgi:UDP-galactopyranose mutase
MTDPVKWLIVGAGLTGATLAERIAAIRGERVLVVERRDHIAGNAHDPCDENGIRIHRYGPHIFHTNSEKVWAYLNLFTTFRAYKHRILASVDGALVPVPFNFRGIDVLFGAEAASRLKSKLVERYGFDARIPILKLREAGDAAIRELAELIYAKVFVGYTTKQWGIGPEDLSPSVTARVPVITGDDDRCFTDRYQGIPVDGYTSMVSRILDHPRVSVSLSTDYLDARADHPQARVIYTGPIDAYFDHCLGALPYRSVRFEMRIERGDRVLPAASVNYPNEHAFTRETEMKQITGQQHPLTAISRDFPVAHERGRNEPYYPIINDDTQALLARYRKLAREEPVLFCGRLGEYRYYDMDQAVGAALATFDGLADRDSR